MGSLRFSFSALAAFALAVVGCGGSTAASPAAPPYVVNPGGDLSLVRLMVDVQRFPSMCGVANPPFTDQDHFSLDVLGENTAISFTCSRNVTVGVPIVLTLAAPSIASSAQQTASSPADSTLQVTFDGGYESEVDPNPLDAATVTVLAFPAKDGDPLTVRFQFHFTDNRKLDETFSGPLYTGFSGCVAG
jgi:hypothetical protein